MRIRKLVKSFLLCPCSSALYLSGEFWRGVTTESQHVLELLNGGGDERDRLILLTHLQLPQATDELRVRRVNQACLGEKMRKRDYANLIIISKCKVRLLSLPAGQTKVTLDRWVG